MMPLFILYVALQCPATDVSTINDLPWTKADQESLEFNKKRCAQKYEHSPCLIKFIKIRENGYIATCGAKRES